MSQVQIALFKLCQDAPGTNCTEQTISQMSQTQIALSKLYHKNTRYKLHCANCITSVPGTNCTVQAVSQISQAQIARCKLCHKYPRHNLHGANCITNIQGTNCTVQTVSQMSQVKSDLESTKYQLQQTSRAVSDII